MSYTESIKQEYLTEDEILHSNGRRWVTAAGFLTIEITPNEEYLVINCYNETCHCITKDTPEELITAQKFIFLKYCTK